MEQLLLGYAHRASLGMKPLYIVVYLIQLSIYLFEHAQYSIQLLFDIHLHFTTHASKTTMNGTSVIRAALYAALTIRTPAK